MLSLIIVSIVFAVVTSVIAHGKGRSVFGWFIAGLLVGPFALVVALLPAVPKEGRFRLCPACSEVVPTDAALCRYCGSSLGMKEVENEG